MADVEALETGRRLVELEHFRERCELRARVRRGRRFHLRAVPGVRHRHLDPAPAVAPQTPPDLDAAPGLLAQHRLERLGLRNGTTDEDLARRLAPAVVLQQ